VSAPPLPLRRVRFEYPEDMDPSWIPDKPEFAYAANSVSLFMPFAEPLFIKAVRHYLPELDEAHQARTRDYIRQEVQHYSEHVRLNHIVERKYPGVARLQTWMKRGMEWIWNKRSRKFSLAYAAGGEMISYGVARWTEKHLGDLFDEADPIVTTLFLWHLAEEVEHKSAAWDVFEAVDGSRPRYAWAAFWGLLSLGSYTWMGTLIQLKGDGRLFSPVAWWRMTRWSFSLAFDLLPTMLQSALPGHRPQHFTDPLFLGTFLKQFDPVTQTMPIWHSDHLDLN
jgi:predicted metal-dependent hydrolase